MKFSSNPTPTHMWIYANPITSKQVLAGENWCSFHWDKYHNIVGFNFFPGFPSSVLQFICIRIFYWKLDLTKRF